MSYDRPSERARPAEKVSYFVQVYTDDETHHGQVLTSPGFGTQAEAVGWVRQNRGGEIRLIRRESDAAHHRDIHLNADDGPTVSRDRFAALLGSCRTTLDEAIARKPTGRVLRSSKVRVDPATPTYDELYGESA